MTKIKFIVFISLLLLVLGGTAKALTYEEIYQAQTGRVLGAATPAFVQGVGSNITDTSSSISQSFVNGVGAHHLIVVACFARSGSLSVSDTLGLTYATAVGPVLNSGYYEALFYAKDSGNGGVDTITCNYSTIGQYKEIIIGEYSGVDTSAPLDVTSSAGGNGTALDSGSASTNFANDLIVGYPFVQNNVSAGAGFNADVTVSGGDLLESKAGVSTGSYNATATESPSGFWGMILATFKPAASGGPTPTPTPTATPTPTGTPTPTPTVTPTPSPTPTPSGPNIYIAQNAAGAGNGSSCANALVYSFFNTASNWASTPTSGKISPGTTVHICGVITGAVSSDLLTFQKSGTAGNPITLFWEPGAKLSSAAFDQAVNTGAGNSYIIVDGNGTNPSIENTANGMGLANQIDSAGVVAQPCNNCEIKNLNINNLYVMTAPAIPGGGGLAIRIQGSHISAHDNTCNNSFVCMDDPYQNGDTDISMYNNTFDHMNWGIHIAGNAPTAVSGIKVYNNHIMDMSNWDSYPNDYYHHDGVFIVQNDPGADISNSLVYNNLFQGDTGQNATAWIYFNTGIHGMYIFNNIFITTGGVGYMVEGGYVGDLNYYVLNNTMICEGGSAVTFGNGTVGETLENNAVDQACYTYWRIVNPVSAFSDYNAFDSTGIHATGHVMKWDDDSGEYWASYLGYFPANDTHTITPATMGWDASYKPQSGSALIGAGTNLTSLGIAQLDVDKAGNARPTSAPWDIGAYQSGSGSGPTTPTITSFSSSPSSINYGQSTTLSWNVSNATSLSISGGVGTVTGTSVNVSPTVTTTYTLTATNSSGSVTAQTTVTVNPNPDTTPPTISITSPSAGTDSGIITFSATASDPVVTGQVQSGLKLITLSVDGSIFATSTSSSIIKSLDTTTLTNASHTLTASAVDNAGNNSTVATVTITVNNVSATKYPRLIQLTSLEGIASIPANQAIIVTILSPSSGSTLETQNLTPTSGKYTVTFLGSDPQLVNIRVKANGYLSQLLSNIDTTVNNSSSLIVNPLLAGDFNNDNIINALDFSLMNSHWLQNYPTADINSDGLINSLDFAVLKNNWNKAGQ